VHQNISDHAVDVSELLIRFELFATFLFAPPKKFSG